MKIDTKIKEVILLFLKLGFTAFGGPAAHIAMMWEEVVVKRKWLTEQHFLDLTGAVNLIPGPNSTEMTMHIGHVRAGWKGLVLAGICFILPAVLITAVFAWFYKSYGQLPEVQPFIYGIKPTIVAIILAAVYPLAKKSLKSSVLVMLGLAVLILSLLEINEILLMFGTGIIAILLSGIRNKTGKQSPGIFPLTFMPLSAATVVSVSNLSLFLIFLKVGSILYGSGYVLFAFLDTELVATGLINRQQLIDAIAVGQFTPGPVFSSVTFIGYQINGWTGAFVATTGIFLPSFLFVALLNRYIKKMRDSKGFSVFLDAVNVAAVAMIISVCFEMGRDSIYDWRTVLIAVLSLVITFGFRKINSALLVFGGSLLGYLLTLV